MFHEDGLKRFHSYLSAVIGSTFAARRVGTQQANKDTTVNRSVMPTNVTMAIAAKPGFLRSILRLNLTSFTMVEN
jgi:hypothetical protein